MGKIDYSKAEREMHDALQRMRVKALAEGKSITSQRAADYYGLAQETPRPTPEEPVAKLVREEAATFESSQKRKKEEESSRKLAEEKAKAAPEGMTPAPQQPPPRKQPVKQSAEPPEEEEFEVVKQTPKYDVLRRARKQSARPPKFIAPPPPDVLPSDSFREQPSPLIVLRQHVLWLKRRHREDRYEILGTTRAEVMAFRTAQRLTEVQIKRIKEINVRAEEVKAEIRASEGIKTEESGVEAQKKKSKEKRFNVKDTWLPL
jgi:hypothetical protein